MGQAADGTLRAFAHLGLTFWNWPPLRAGFVAAARRLGHRIRLGAGRV
ncbi:hypothetical protein [Dactylosporangium sp. CA-139066]